MLKLTRICAFALASTVLFIGAGTATVHAADKPSTQAIAQSYATDTTISRGMIVGFKKGDASKVVALPSDRVSDMLGAVIAANDAAITLSSSAASSQVYVATSGQYSVLVSDQNGPIRVGDLISISSLNGIGMKAKDTQPTVLGKAMANFTGNANVISTAKITSGHSTVTASIGIIPVNIAIGSNPTFGHGLGDLPGFIQVTGSAIADKPISAPRAYISLAILIVSTLIAASLLYSGVRTAIVSIGRNPLAKRYIIRGLLQVIFAGLIVFILGLFAVYLLLKL